MSRFIQAFSALPQTTMRRLRTTPAYFFLIWRWTTWLYAFLWILFSTTRISIALVLLVVTFVQSLIITLYAPFQTLFSDQSWLSIFRLNKQRSSRLRKRQRQMVSGHRNPSYPHLQSSASETEQAELHSDRRSVLYRDILIYGLDVIICGLVTYLSGPYWSPGFGDGSPFYRYGFSAAFVAAFAYRYKGGLLAAFVYDLFILLGAYFPPPTTVPVFSIHPNIQDLLSSLIDVPLAALLAAYLATLLDSYIRSKRQEQDNLRQQRTLLAVGETLIVEASNKERLLKNTARQIRIGGHFERVILAIIAPNISDENIVETDSPTTLEIELSIEAGLVDALSPDTSRTLLEHTARTGQKLLTFEMLYQEDRDASYGIARLYMPFFTDGRVSLILGAESVRQSPFEEKQEKFMTIVGSQLVVALENMRLIEQTADLAAAAERGRIAREMHDGVAQLVYMLSFHTETCAALSLRLEEELPIPAGSQLKPLTERLDKLVNISKQALWETRHYMFTLKPLISGTTTISEMLTNQVREFEAISGISAQLEIIGQEKTISGELQQRRKITRVGTAIFRITQEALSNAYKHAEATQIQIRLYYQTHQVEVQIDDNGKGFPTEMDSDRGSQRIYSGHGIQGMRERASELGGELKILQRPQSGVRIIASIPI